MDFSKLSHHELMDFIHGDYPINPDESLPLVEQAEELFNQLKNHPGTKFPLPVIDLYLASKYDGPMNKHYTESQIGNLNENEILQFANVFQFEPTDDLETNRERIFRILSYLGLIYRTMVPELLETTVLQNLCSTLSLEELNNFRKANYLDRLNCRIPLDYLNKSKRSGKRVKFVNYLDDQSYDWLKQIQDFGSHNTLVSAININNFDLFKFTIDGGYRQVNSFVIDSIPLISYTIWKNRPEMTKHLVEKGANVNKIWHEWKWTPLNVAIHNNNLDMVKYLVEHGAQINPQLTKYRNPVSKPPITMTSEHGYLDIVKYLVENGADMLRYGIITIIEASRNGHLPIVKYLLDEVVQIDNDDVNLIISELDHSDPNQIPVIKYLESLV